MIRNNKNRPTVFISYCWEYASSRQLARNIQKTLQEQYRIDAQIDVVNMRKWDNIKSFMNTISSDSVDFVVLILDDAYFKSHNSAYEARTAYHRNNHRADVLPIITKEGDLAGIIRPESHYRFVEFWNKKVQEMHTIIRGFSSYEGHAKDLQRYEECRLISAEIGGILAEICETNCVFEREPVVDIIIDHMEQLGWNFDFARVEGDAEAGAPNLGVNKDEEGGITQMYNNELRNWYFIEPINSRKQQSYVRNHSYTVDGWLISYTSGSSWSLALTNKGLRCSCDSGAKDSAMFFNQIIEYPERFNGRTVTLSIDIAELASNRACIQLKCSKDDHLISYGEEAIDKLGITSLTVTLPDKLTSLQARVYIEDSERSYITIKQMKLEPGNQSTLALDIPPLPHNEATRCYRYSFVIKRGTVVEPYPLNDRAYCYQIITPVPLRANPSICLTENLVITNVENLQQAVEPSLFNWQASVMDNILVITATYTGKGSLPFRPKNSVLCVVEDTILDCEM